MKLFLSLTIGLAILLAASTVTAGDARDALVDSQWLQAHLSDPDLVLLHVGAEEEFAQGHIPGARLVSLDDISVSEHNRNGLMLELPEAEDLRARLEKLGISDGAHIVVYYGQDWVSPSTRVVFTLQAAGLGDCTHLLDGGMQAWVRSGGVLSKEPAPTRPGELSPIRMQALTVDADDVRAHLDAPGVKVIDGRAAVYYDGIETGGAHGQADRTGHIKGALSIPYTEVTDEQLNLRSRHELRALFTRAGVEPGDTIVGYCHIGQQATAMLFAARLLGHPVRLYDGSFQDWSRSDENPFEATQP